MTDAELQRAWSDGRTIPELARLAGVSYSTIQGRIRRLRRREGDDVMPKRAPMVAVRKEPQPKRLKPGQSTLPPLGSIDAS